MPSIKQLQRQFQGIQDVRQPVRAKFHALIGHPDGTTIEDPETAGYVFVRIDGDSNRVRRALCREVLQRYNQPVIVAYSDQLPNTLEVITLDVNAFEPSSGGGSSWDGGAQLGAHAGQHDVSGGDTDWIQSKRLLPLRTRPAVPASMRVYVESGPYQYQLGSNYWPGGYSSDMTAQIPAADLQLYRVIYIAAATNTLTYANTATMPIDPYLADFEAVLDLIPTNCVPLSAVRLYNGQTTIAEADIYDLRSLISSAPGTATATAHNLLSAVHGDTLTASVVDGDIIIGNVTPAWSRLAISIPAANVRNVLGIDNAELRPSWKTALDATNPTTISVGASASPGTSLVFSHRDHTHGAPSTWTATAHDIVGAVHIVTGSQYQLVGLTAVNALGLLTPASTVGANQIPIGGAGGAITWSGAQTFNAGAIAASGCTHGWQCRRLPRRGIK